MAELRYILVPDSLPFIIHGHPWSWCRCVEFMIQKDPRFNSDGDGIRAASRILKAIKDETPGAAKVWLVEPGDVVVFDHPDWKLLHTVMEKPLIVSGYESWTCLWLGPVFAEVQMEDGKKARMIADSPPGVAFLPWLDCLSDENTRKKIEPKPKPLPPPEGQTESADPATGAAA